MAASVETPTALTGRTVLVTGASSGLGARFALIAARAGASIVAGARRTDRLQKLVEAIEQGGGQATAVPLDVSDEASVEAAFDAAETRFGTVTGVVANAGITADAPAIDLPIADFDRVFATNVRGAFLTARTAARRLQQAGQGAGGR